VVVVVVVVIIVKNFVRIRSAGSEEMRTKQRDRQNSSIAGKKQQAHGGDAGSNRCSSAEACVG